MDPKSFISPVWRALLSSGKDRELMRGRQAGKNCNVKHPVLNSKSFYIDQPQPEKARWH